MTRGDSRIVPSGVWLLLVLALYAVLWVLCPREFSASDPYVYSSRAFEISRGLGLGESDVFNHRLAVTLPVALLYAMFGVNLVTTNLWPLCCALLIVVVAWLALPDPRSRFLGAVVCLTSVPLFRSSVALYPDVIATAFMAASTLVLLKRRAFLGAPRAWILSPLAAVVLLFVAFLAKESAYWALPLWALAFFADVRGSDGAALLRRFHLPALAVGVLLGVAYLLFCHATWGDPLARFRSVEAVAGHHLWSWDRASSPALAERLTSSPIQLLLDRYGPPILLLGLLGIFAAPRPLRPWGYYAGFCLFFFWFGTTSFTGYEPMPLDERMVLPALPGLCVLAAFLASRLSIGSGRAARDGSFLPALLVVGLTAIPFAQYVSSWKGHEPAEARAMAVVRREVTAHPEERYLLVCSDSRSPESLSFHFGYRYPANLRAAWAGALTDSLARSADRWFLFLHRQRSAFLKSAYGQPHFDMEMIRLRLSPRYESGVVVLFAPDSANALAGLLRQESTAAPAR